MDTMAPSDPFVRVARVDEVLANGPLVVRPGGTSIALFAHDEEIYAIDNRCPHMGFPLSRGTIENGILTCHWHHARFELSCGDTFDPFADDVRAYPVMPHDGDVFVNPTPNRDRDPVEHWTARLEHGLREHIGLVIAKAVIALQELDVDAAESIRRATTFGVQYNARGWATGLTTLGAMANLHDHVDPGDRPRALYTGITAVARDCAGEPPLFTQDPLSATDIPPNQLDAWFRNNIEVRDADGAERVLRAAIRQGLPEEEIVAMLVGATTDHLFLDTGHRLDFTNKAVEVLDRIGWTHADAVLPALVPGLAGADRAEERSSWRQPIDLAALLFDTYDQLPDATADERDDAWAPSSDLTDVLLGEDPARIVERILDEIRRGAPASALASETCLAAAHRVARFGTSNEFRDWNTVHHTYSHANAVHGLSHRTHAWVVFRGILETAMRIYLDRFLNMPPTPMPECDHADRTLEQILEDLSRTFEVERDETVDRAGRLVAEYLDGGGERSRLVEALGRALLREDAGFHPRQNLEAAISICERDPRPRSTRVHLIAAARYLAAHTPTRRAEEQTYRIAERLHRGERIHEAT